MLGYDMDMALAAIVEVMASAKFTIRRSAYLAASLGFSKHVELALLTVNIFKKDFGSGRPFETGTALSCLACICSAEMAACLVDDVLRLLTSSRPYVRKKSLLALFRMCEAYPPALAAAFPKIKDALSDEDQSVLTACINTILEIAIRNPRNILPLLPSLFHLLTSGHNNWMLIKLLKVFQQLARVESRLGPKRSPVLVSILQTTKAKSVEIETLRTVSALNSGCTEALKTEASSRMADLMISTDRNIRALALEILGTGNFSLDGGLESLLLAVEDSDSTISKAALASLRPAVNAENFVSVVTALVTAANRTKRVEFISAVLSLGSNGDLIPDNEWYFLLLLELLKTEVSVSASVSDNLKKFVSTGSSIQPYAFKVATSLASSDVFPLLPKSCTETVAWLIAGLAGNQISGSSVESLPAIALGLSTIQSTEGLWLLGKFVLAWYVKFGDSHDLRTTWEGILESRQTPITCILTRMLPVSPDDPGLFPHFAPLLDSDLHFDPVGKRRFPTLPPELRTPIVALPDAYDFQKYSKVKIRQSLFIDERDVYKKETAIDTDFLKAFKTKLTVSVPTVSL